MSCGCLLKPAKLDLKVPRAFRARFNFTLATHWPGSGKIPTLSNVLRSGALPMFEPHREHVQNGVSASSDREFRHAATGNDFFVASALPELPCSTSSSDSTPAAQWGNASLIARRVIDVRLDAYRRCLMAVHSTNKLKRALNFLSGLVAPYLPAVLVDSVIWSWYNIPILLNERWLNRKSQLRHWQYGLITLSDASVVFPNSNLNYNNSARLIFRPNFLPGYEILCEGRDQHVSIQPSVEGFRTNFEFLTDRLLKNLNWDNVIVAGGIVLGALMATPPYTSNGPHPNQWAAASSSDIDMYIYGLTAQDANKKLVHIFDVFRSNLPPPMRTLAVRNCKTITFYAEYPLRRIQIVLKLAENPRDVLLNFDLDICAMGWDGENVWMLPRAARALELFLNTPTAFGYGIRILPSYLSSLDRRSCGSRPPFNTTLLEGEVRAWIEHEVDPDDFRRPDWFALKSTRTGILNGFVPLMRHVLMRKLEGSQMLYQWNEAFNHSRFRTHILYSNVHDVDEWIRTDIDRRLHHHGVESGDELNHCQRMVYASTAKELLQGANDIRMAVILPSDFAIYANAMADDVLASAGLQGTKILRLATQQTTEHEGLFLWTIDSHLMWQQLDRRADELFEVLYAFRRANAPLREDLQLQRLTKELSRRSIHTTEFDAFARWMGQRP
ncbi:hypothetical protein B0H16DRAFT_1469551 [Mycena metata]|uniref:Uncharacterized protein n=1 Tax=Mycena metata TaxID=1033252 RepID=A0AAD7HZ40_9AGAR|nr:hypothetical protein B0H16DRAFT_1469551 [Mycena metata]